jgi:hypothetical protein
VPGAIDELRDLDHQGRDAPGVGEGQHRRLLTHEQHRRRGFLRHVAGRTAGGAVVAVWGGAAAQQAIGLVVTDLGTDLVADVDHALHE